MMTSLAELSAWLISDLRAELVRSHPETISRFEKALGDGTWSLEFQEEFAASLDYKQPQPWCDALTGILALELGLLDLDFAVEKFGISTTKQEEFFFEQMVPIIASSCLERLEYVSTKLGRGVNAPIQKSLADSLTQSIAKEREKFAQLRHGAAHGPHLTLSAGGWLAEAGNYRLWEITALEQGSAADVLSSVLASFFDASRENHSEKFRATAGFSLFLHARVQAYAAELLLAASRNRGP